MNKMLKSIIGLGMGASLFSQVLFASNVNTRDSQVYDGVVRYVNEVYVNVSSEDKSKLIEELYKLRLEGNNEDMQVDSISSLIVEQEIDSAYERIMDEENYIVNLINQTSDTNTTIENWEFNLVYLQEHYDEIKNMKNINLEYVDSYIEAYEIVRLNEAMPSEKVYRGKTVRAGYSRTEAVNYAKEWYNKFNDNDYPNWTSEGGDCANFVSQCLEAGGKTEVGTPGTAAAAQNFANWFSEGNVRNVNYVSSTWRGADAFRNYWQSNSTSYKKFTIVDRNTYEYGFLGDAVTLLNSNGRGVHTMIIVGYDTVNSDFILGAHTAPTITAKLSSKVTSSGFIIYNLY